ncbi:MAG: helix-turn-helix domain-containing protein [Candidatus Riflebacteria bacterium]|nr:helix-turn-helix domain-containing protein [Candidatus Riflebacteria bacterium]
MVKESLMTIPELMEFLQVKRNTIYTLRNLGLPTVKIGRSVRFRVDSVVKWLGELEKASNTSVTNYLGKV